MKPIATLKFGEWMPDQPPFDNPGSAYVKNVYWVNGNYQPATGFKSLFTQGTVISVKVTNPGNGYLSSDTITFSDAPSGGTTATGTITVSDDDLGTITGVVLTNKGAGYTSAPTITINTSTGSGAVLTAILYSITQPYGASFITDGATSYSYVGTDTHVYAIKSDSITSVGSGYALLGDTYWRFCQFGISGGTNYVFATNRSGSIQYGAPGDDLGPQVTDVSGWVASTAYTVGQSIVDSNGNVQKCTTAGTSGSTAPQWSQALAGTTTDGSGLWWGLEATHTYTWGSGNTYLTNDFLIDSNGNLQRCISAGVSGSSAPSWATSVGAQTQDGSSSEGGVVWECFALSIADWAASTAYTTGTYVTDSNGGVEEAISDGTSGSTAPAWPTTVGGTVADGGSGVIWTNISLGQMPWAQAIAVIGQFLMVGDTYDVVNSSAPSRVQWSAIGNPINWPVPNTENAFAYQAGDEWLNPHYGKVQCITPGTTFGLIFQERSITMAYYQGGDTVFYFNTYERQRGTPYPNSPVQVGQLVYFIAHDGFFVTDGEATRPIGHAKVDGYFAGDVSSSYQTAVRGAYDPVSKLVMWCYCSTSNATGKPDKIIAYNYAEDKFCNSEVDLDLLFQAQDFTTGDIKVGAIDTSKNYGDLTGDALDATIDTPEASPNPGGMTNIIGVRPIISGSPAALSAAMLTRNIDNEDATTGSTVDQNTRTGRCDVRTSARYIRARIGINGGFDQAIACDIYGTAAGNQ